MEMIVEVKLRESVIMNCYKVKDLHVAVGDCVIVEGERGIDYGYVHAEVTGKHHHPKATKSVVRIVTDNDKKQINENKKKAKETFTVCLESIKSHALEMKLVSAEFSFDRSKVLFYFTAEGRIDFRSLVKDLARRFKARIEMRQIGVRDEAKLFGGYGSCGRELCCSRFLNDFEPVTIKMAKEQGLPLNPPKISGLCGRLMCCLAYEHKCYRELSRGLPREGDKVDTPQGKGKVVNVNVLRRAVLVDIGAGKQVEVVYKSK